MDLYHHGLFVLFDAMELYHHGLCVWRFGGFLCSAAHHTLNQAFAFSFGSSLRRHFANQAVVVFGSSFCLISRIRHLHVQQRPSSSSKNQALAYGNGRHHDVLSRRLHLTAAVTFLIWRFHLAAAFILALQIGLLQFLAAAVFFLFGGGIWRLPLAAAFILVLRIRCLRSAAAVIV